MSLGKRLFDFVLVTPLLLICSPIFAVCAMLVAMDGGPCSMRTDGLAGVAVDLVATNSAR